jgi:nitrilase
MIEMLAAGPEGEKFLRDPDCCGGSVIVAPNSRIIAGPMGAEEGILYAECNLELGILTKLRHDFAGHYNRPDIFQLHVNRAAPHLYTVHGEPDALSAPDPPRAALAQPPSGLLGSPDDAADIAPTGNGAGRDEP